MTAEQIAESLTHIDRLFTGEGSFPVTETARYRVEVAALESGRVGAAIRAALRTAAGQLDEADRMETGPGRDAAVGRSARNAWRAVDLSRQLVAVKSAAAEMQAGRG
jgi:hypothetical protein